MSTKQNSLRVIALLPLLLLLSTSLVLAQGQGGSGSNGQGDQMQDRDRVQDPTVYEEDEPLQDRDRLRDGSGDNCVNTGDCDGVPDQDRLQTQDRDQLRDRLQDQFEDPEQDRDRDRIRANDATELQEVIATSEAVSDGITSGLEAKIRELARSRNRVEVGVTAFIVAQNMIGQDGSKIANLAQEIHSAHRTMTEEEEKIRSQGFFSRFFFGGDSISATSIQNQLQQNEQRMQQVREYLNNSDSEEQVRTILQEQMQNIEEEHVRLRQLAEDEVSAWGLFSWRF